MATKTQEQFLNDVKTQIMQFVYRSSEAPVTEVIKFLQEASGNNSLNWHLLQNKEKLASIFTQLAEEINNYSLADGDFRTYVLMKHINIIYNTYEGELVAQFLRQGYNVVPESVVGSVSDAYSTQPPQNTNFPGTNNTANKFVPVAPTERLVPSSLYSTSD
jgi:hypothetical protein